MSMDMVFAQSDSPGWPTLRYLVHPECKDQPHPSARPVRTKAPVAPRIIQNETETLETHTASIALTAATFAATGTTTATQAQLAVDPTVTLTGTGYTTACRGRIHHDSPMPLERATTYVGATSITFELLAADYAATGTLRVGAEKLPSSSSGYHITPVSSTVALTVT